MRERSAARAIPGSEHASSVFSDLAYADQDYWRGRTWGPLNYLVHSALSESAYTDGKRWGSVWK